MCHTVLQYYIHCGHTDVSFVCCEDDPSWYPQFVDDGLSIEWRDHGVRNSVAHSYERECPACVRVELREWKKAPGRRGRRGRGVGGGAGAWTHFAAASAAAASTLVAGDSGDGSTDEVESRSRREDGVIPRRRVWSANEIEEDLIEEGNDLVGSRVRDTDTDAEASYLVGNFLPNENARLRRGAISDGPITRMSIEEQQGSEPLESMSRHSQGSSSIPQTAPSLSDVMSENEAFLLRCKENLIMAKDLYPPLTRMDFQDLDNVLRRIFLPVTFLPTNWPQGSRNTIESKDFENISIEMIWRCIHDPLQTGKNASLYAICTLQRLLNQLRGEQQLDALSTSTAQYGDSDNIDRQGELPTSNNDGIILDTLVLLWFVVVMYGYRHAHRTASIVERLVQEVFRSRYRAILSLAWEDFIKHHPRIQVDPARIWIGNISEHGAQFRMLLSQTAAEPSPEYEDSMETIECHDISRMMDNAMVIISKEDKSDDEYFEDLSDWRSATSSRSLLDLNWSRIPPTIVASIPEYSTVHKVQSSQPQVPLSTSRKQCSVEAPRLKYFAKRKCSHPTHCQDIFLHESFQEMLKSPEHGSKLKPMHGDEIHLTDRTQTVLFQFVACGHYDAVHVERIGRKDDCDSTAACGCFGFPPDLRATQRAYSLNTCLSCRFQRARHTQMDSVSNNLHWRTVCFDAYVRKLTQQRRIDLWPACGDDF